jgi:hypothetical protein
MSAAAAETYLLDVQRLLFMANPSAPYFGIWRLFIDESRTKINDFYEIDDINTFGAGALDQIVRRYIQKMRINPYLMRKFVSSKISPNNRIHFKTREKGF